eukprot:SAG22_NODE_4922_length_1131_cov_1.278101_3_plen_184_part_01
MAVLVGMNSTGRGQNHVRRRSWNPGPHLISRRGLLQLRARVLAAVVHRPPVNAQSRACAAATTTAAALRRELSKCQKQRDLLAADCVRLRALQQTMAAAVNQPAAAPAVAAAAGPPPPSPSPPLKPAPVAAAPAPQEGYLFKLGAGTMSQWKWSRRYFVLHGQRLVYYEAAADIRAGRAPKGVV